MIPPVLVGVYDGRNADQVARLVEPAVRAGWEVGLWSLGPVPSTLANVTRGSGAGLRLENLNRVLADVGGLPRWVVLCDDDVEFVRGDVVRLVAACEAAGFGIAQPAHAVGSHVSHPHTRAMPWSRARSVTFVEAGPVAVIAPEWCRRVFPLPARRGMGWGLELEWMDLRATHCVLGVVDSVSFRHLAPVGTGYDESAERKRFRADLEEREIVDLSSVQSTLAVWRPWRRRPPWPVDRHYGSTP